MRLTPMRSIDDSFHALLIPINRYQTPSMGYYHSRFISLCVLRGKPFCSGKLSNFNCNFYFRLNPSFFVIFLFYLFYTKQYYSSLLLNILYLAFISSQLFLSCINSKTVFVTSVLFILA